MTGCQRRRRREADAESSADSPSRLYRDPDNGYLFGVAAGIAEYFGIEGWIVRALMILGLFMFAPPILFGYLMLAIILRRKPEQLYRDSSEERFWRDVRVDPSSSFSRLRHRFRELEHRLRNMEAYVTSDAYRVHREINDLER